VIRIAHDLGLHARFDPIDAGFVEFGAHDARAAIEPRIVERRPPVAQVGRRGVFRCGDVLPGLRHPIVQRRQRCQRATGEPAQYAGDGDRTKRPDCAAWRRRRQ
jgi:hypothetical protein